MICRNEEDSLRDFSIITVDRKAPKALYRQIYDAYRTTIVDGGLRPGQRIPSTRMLASELGISRLPVLNAYSRALGRRLFREPGRRGNDRLQVSSGPTHVKHATGANGRKPSPVPARSRAAVSILPRFARAPWLLERGAFGVGQVAFDQFPLQIWSRLVARHCRNLDARSFHYGESIGSPALRETIATYLRTARSLHCEAEQIAIVSGSQQALEISARLLLTRKLCVDRGPGLLFGARCLRVDGLPSRTGSRRQGRSGCCRRHQASSQGTGGVCYALSSISTGRDHERFAAFPMLDWAQNSGSWIIEDDYDSEYRYESLPIPSLQGLDASARVIYIGTFSKVLFPSLRLGYVVVPLDLVDRFCPFDVLWTLAHPPSIRKCLRTLFSEGHFARHVRRMRVLYRERRSALVACIDEELGAMVEVLGGEAGMHLAVILPNGSPAIWKLPSEPPAKSLVLASFSLLPGQGARPGFILGFGSTAVGGHPPAVRKLGRLLGAK